MGHGDGGETLEHACPIHRGRLVQLLGHALQGRRNHDGKKRNAIPDVGHNDGVERAAHLGQETVLRLQNTQFNQDVIDDAGRAVEHPAPHDADDKARDGPGKENKPLVHALAPKVLLQNQRHDKPDEELTRQRHHHPFERVEQRGVEHIGRRYLKQLAEVIQSNPLDVVEIEQRIVLKCHGNAAQQRVIRQREHGNQAGQHHQKDESPLAGGVVDASLFLFHGRLLRQQT